MRGVEKKQLQELTFTTKLLVLVQNDGFRNPNPFPSDLASLSAVGRDYYLMSGTVASPTPKEELPHPSDLHRGGSERVIQRDPVKICGVFPRWSSAWKSLREIDPNPRSRPRNPD